MARFFTGLIKGGVLSAVALVTASVLLPARPKVSDVDVVAAPMDPAPLVVDANQVDATKQPEIDSGTPKPDTAKPDTAEPDTAEPDPAEPDPANVAPSDPATTPPQSASDKPPAQPSSLAKDALLDPSAEVAASEPMASGAKTVAAPSPDGQEAEGQAAEGQAAEGQAIIGNDSIAATSQAISPPESVAASTPQQPAESAPLLVNAPPLQKYAAMFDNPGTKPLFAVILQDTGAQDLDRAALAALPFPVTFAIDPEMENATAAMAIYRAGGKEVVMLTAGLPDGATAQDLEQSFQTYNTILPETVAVMGPAKGGFQDSAILSKLIVPVISAQGRGLITFDRGLNSAAQNAAREGLANGTVFRQVDGTGESVPVIRRYLDRAVFKAAQDGFAIVMGESLPDTITALMEWSIEGRASDVTLAPVSAILR